MSKRIVFTFGRFQTPTKGHEELIRFVMTYANSTGAEARIYPSKTHDSSRNPLPYPHKIQFLRQLFPWANIVDDPKAVNLFAICRDLSNKGYTDVVFVTGDDRVDGFESMIKRYILSRNDPSFNQARNYGFNSFKVISSGARYDGVSGTDMRQHVLANKFDRFMSVLPTKNKVLGKRIFNTAKAYLKEESIESGMTRKEFDALLHSFIDFACDKLGVDEKPVIQYKDDKGEGQPSFGGYAPGSKTLMVYTKHRHPMDILRTVAHELVHHKQNNDGRLGKDIEKEGATGSDIENEANSEAGKIMRWFGKANPHMFDKSYVVESKAIFLGGVPGSGKDRILKEAILPHNYKEISLDNFNESCVDGDNLVINGTMIAYEKVRSIKNLLESEGYSTIMFFVNTSNDVSKMRNEARATKGGRVINETVRFNKWQEAQVNLEKYDTLFEKVVEIKNDLDANTIRETYNKFIQSISEEVENFSKTAYDHTFETMLNEVGGAGNWGTPMLTNRYKADTPGQEPKKTRQMGYFKPKTSIKIFDKNPNISGDRLGSTYTSAKNPSFVGNISGDVNDFTGPETWQKWSPIDRWSVNEDTKKRFKERYGKLAEQKIKETAEKLKLRKESLVDPYIGAPGMTPNASNVEDNRPDINSEFEKLSFHKYRKYRKNSIINNRNNKDKG